MCDDEILATDKPVLSLGHVLQTPITKVEIKMKQAETSPPCNTVLQHFICSTGVSVNGTISQIMYCYTDMSERETDRTEKALGSYRQGNCHNHNILKTKQTSGEMNSVVLLIAIMLKLQGLRLEDGPHLTGEHVLVLQGVSE